MWSNTKTTYYNFVAPSVTTAWTITISNVCGSATDNITVNVIPIPAANLGADKDITAGQSVKLETATDASYSYLWSNTKTTYYNFVAPSTTMSWTITVSNVCGSATDGITVNVSGSPGSSLLSINDNNNKLSSTIYPNPSDGIFNVTINNIKNENIKVEVLNSLGQIVFEDNKNAINNKFYIDIRNFAKGIYQLRITSPKDVLIRSIMKQ